MKKNFQTPPSPFKALETHFLNVFHSGIYISGSEMVHISKSLGYDIPLKSREIVMKTLLSTANEKGDLPQVVAALSTLIHDRIDTLNALAHDFPNAAVFLRSIIQKSTSTDLLLKRQQKANPYE